MRKNNKYYQTCITFGRAAEGLRADFQQQLIEMQQEIGFSYVRFHGIFHDDMAVYLEDEEGRPILWFGYIDSLFDFLLKNNLKPFLELGFMPTALATVPNTIFWWHANGCPPKDYGKWHYLVKETLTHLVERYGLSEVKTWYFEVWNEPNLRSFWRGTQDEYFRLYEVTVDAVKSVSVELRIGGPSSSGADFRENLTYLKAFIDFCTHKKLPIDFFSAHPYPTYWPLDTDGKQQMGYMDKKVCSRFIDHMKSIVDTSEYAQAEIHLTEWNSSPSPRDLVHDTPFKAPFIIYNVTQNFGKIHSLGYWTFTDVFEENGPGMQPFHGGFGLINMHGIRKPSYHAYRFLSMLGDEILTVSENHILTKQDQAYQLLVWNYCHYTDAFAKGDRSNLSLTDRDAIFERKWEHITIRIPLDGRHRLTEYTLNESTSALHNWIKHGAPQYPMPEQIEVLRKESEPMIRQQCLSEFSLDITLNPHEVKLYLLEKDV